MGGKWKKILLILKQFHENCRSKTPRFWDIKSLFRDDALMHSEGAKGFEQTIHFTWSVCVVRVRGSYAWFVCVVHVRVRKNSWEMSLVPSICTCVICVRFFKETVKVQVHSVISSLKTYHPTLHLTPWSLDLYICVPFQLHGEYTVLQSGALNLSYTLPSPSYQLLIFTWVKWSIWGWSGLPKDTTSFYRQASCIHLPLQGWLFLRS